MPGPLPKNPKTRQRTNKTATHATFVDDGSARFKRSPALPKGVAWHELTRAWWTDVWASPMREEYLRLDVHGLYRLAYLINRFWLTGDDKLSAEIRNLAVRYGQDPMARRSLQWEVLKVEEAEARAKRRRPAVDTEARDDDPRAALRVVS